MENPSIQSASTEDISLDSVSAGGYVVTNEMYSKLYHLYYQRCARHSVPCLVVVRHGSHCRLDLDMTCSSRELTVWARELFQQLFADEPVDEIYHDEVYFWATRVPNRMADRLARSLLAVLDDGRSSESA